LDNFKNIQNKLYKFIKKYYLNELLKGLLLFFSIGLLYFIFTLIVEYFLWLTPIFRTFLFWIFVLVELFLVVVFIAFPIAKLIGFKGGITEEEASKIIGNHFPEVRDKLLNMLQLNNLEQHSNLIKASIEQKSEQLKLIPFKRAVNFSSNLKYVKYAVIPILVILLIYFSGNISIFNQSFKRVIHYKTAYSQPAPFTFNLLNKTLTVVEGNSLKLNLETVGFTIPEGVNIIFLNENNYVINKGFGKFEYTFTNLQKPLNFYFKANGFTSQKYQITVLEKPSIINLKMVLDYPNYTHKKNEVISNTGNAVVPQGTKISWQIDTQKTTEVNFTENTNKRSLFKRSTSDYFSFSKVIMNDLNYTITTSNKQLTNYETINYNIKTIQDEFPKITIKSDIDSISRGPVQFAGQVSDDYGIRKLQLVYYATDNIKDKKIIPIDIPKNTIADLYIIFPNNEKLKPGKEYEMYFEVFDNDAVHGSKKVKSNTFSYYKKTENELKNEVLHEQKKNINNLSKILNTNNTSSKEFEKLRKEIQKKSTTNWDDTQLLKEFLKKKNSYLDKLLKQTNTIEIDLKEEPANKNNQEKKEELLKRIEELKKIAKNEKLLNDLNELTKKLQKEDLLKKLDEMAQKNKRNKKSLERLLELTKRFYVEKKANQISENLKKLAEKQKILANNKISDSSQTKQNNINIKFENIKNELQKLHQENNKLDRPMKLKEFKEDASEISQNLKSAIDKLLKKNNDAKTNQKSAAKKMKELGKAMEQSIQKMDGEEIDENIDDLRKILDNLIEFSFKQENLFNAFSNKNINHPDYPKNLKAQQTLKEYFEHIDDSLYVLSLRIITMTNDIQTEVSNTHFNINQALKNLSDNQLQIGISNQRFVITSANNLANMLSNLLDQLMNASPSFGKGKSGKLDFSLPDIIKKQGDLTKQAKKQGDKNKGGKKKGSNGQQNEQTNAEIYKIYQEQA